MSPSEIAGVPPRTRNWIARAFSLVEDVAYIGLGLLLAGCAIALLIDAVYGFMHQFATTSMLSNTVGLLDRILLILVVIELLYTVQVSFREHAVVPEPFLLVGVIAAIRRVLIITAEFSQARPLSETMFQHFVVELGILTLLIVALAISLLLLKKRETVAAVTKSDMAKR